jgi:ribosomal-protein-alanine N-acetyltransferase
MLETTRLILRPFTENDVDAVFALRNDAEMMRFIRPPQKHRRETENWVNLVSSRWQSEKIGIGAIVEKQSRLLIGWCGLWRLTETGEIELGYAIAKEFWGKGMATEAARRFLEYGFNELNIEKIASVARPENMPSRRVMEKTGMHFDYLGEFYDREMVHYSIEKADWNKENGVKQNSLIA